MVREIEEILKIEERESEKAEKKVGVILPNNTFFQFFLFC